MDNSKKTMSSAHSSEVAHVSSEQCQHENNGVNHARPSPREKSWTRSFTTSQGALGNCSCWESKGQFCLRVRHLGQIVRSIEQNKLPLVAENKDTKFGWVGRE